MLSSLPCFHTGSWECDPFPPAPLPLCSSIFSELLLVSIRVPFLHFPIFHAAGLRRRLSCFWSPAAFWIRTLGRWQSSSACGQSSQCWSSGELCRGVMFLKSQCYWKPCYSDRFRLEQWPDCGTKWYTAWLVHIGFRDLMFSSCTRNDGISQDDPTALL